MKKLKELTSKQINIIGLSIIALLIVITGCFKVQQAVIHQKTEQRQTVLSKLQADLSKKAETLNALQTQFSDNNSQAQKALQNKIDATLKGFFGTVYTWNSQISYDNRKEKAAKYVTDNVLNDKYLFGGNVNVNKTQARFNGCETSINMIDSNTVKCIVKVSYSASNQSRTAGKKGLLYTATYEISQDKFSNVEFLGNVTIGVDK